MLQAWRHPRTPKQQRQVMIEQTHSAVRSSNSILLQREQQQLPTLANPSPSISQFSSRQAQHILSQQELRLSTPEQQQMSLHSPLSQVPSLQFKLSPQEQQQHIEDCSKHNNNNHFKCIFQCVIIVNKNRYEL